MCEAPIPSGDGWSEVMVGYGAGAYGGVWAAKDAPMKLHLFEYIVRGALLKWWESMLSAAEVKIQEASKQATPESAA
jgi:hypothetical protein